MLLSWKNQIGKITVVPTAMYRFNVIPIELPRAVFTVLEQQKIIFSFVWKHERSQITKAILRKENRVGGIRSKI